jgi:hypothetical protein
MNSSVPSSKRGIAGFSAIHATTKGNGHHQIGMDIAPARMQLGKGALDPIHRRKIGQSRKCHALIDRLPRPRRKGRQAFQPSIVAPCALVACLFHQQWQQARAHAKPFNCRRLLKLV